MSHDRTNWRLPKRSAALSLGALAVFLGLQGIARAAPEDDAAWIDGLHQRAETILRGPTNVEADRTRRLEGLIVEGFDLPALGTFALGRHAKDAEPVQIERFQDLFGGYALRNYTRYLAGTGTKPFFVDRGRRIGDDETVVKTRLGLADDEDLEVVWHVRNEDGDRKIVDLFVEGVSMALTLRQEFGSVIGAGGMESLLDALDGRATGEPAFKSTGKATRFLLQSQMGAFGALPAGPR